MEWEENIQIISKTKRRRNKYTQKLIQGRRKNNSRNNFIYINNHNKYKWTKFSSQIVKIITLDLKDPVMLLIRDTYKL